MNNKGLSLVELLVAIAVSMLVLGGLAYMIINVMNMFGRTNANVELQNESQTAMNLVIDNVMDATGICMIEVPAASVGSTPVCLLLGELAISEVDFNSVSFVGDAVIWDPAKKEMYLKTYQNVTEGALSIGGATSESEAAIKAVEEVRDQVLNLTDDDRLPYLMARYVSSFDVKTADYYTFPPSEEKPDPDNPGSTKTVHYYTSPMILQLEMNFEMEYKPGSFYKREIKEEIAVRNRMPYLYMQRVGSGMIKYFNQK